MAKMFPDWTDAELEQKIPNTQDGYDGERKLYKELRKLPKTWYVLYDRTLSDGSGENQVDFLVFVPDMGVVNVDAKGGSAEPGEGYHIIDGTVYLGNTKKRPFDQARGAIKRFSDRVYAMLGLPAYNPHTGTTNYWGAYGSLVAFTNKDLQIPNEDDQSAYIGATDLYTKGRLEERIIAQLKRYNNHEERFRAFSRYMKQILARWTVTDDGRYVSREFAENDARADVMLSVEQARITAQINRAESGVVHVCGAAGTGKTLLACRIASDYLRNGKRSLYVCYNETLALALRTDSRNNGIKISTYHTLGSNVFNDTSLSVWKGGVFDRSETYTKIKDALLNVETRNKFDCIVVDEAQDLVPMGDYNEILSLRGLLKRSGTMVIFSDKGQSLYSSDWELDESALSPEKQVVQHILDCNYRNKEKVHKHFCEYNCSNVSIVCVLDGGVVAENYSSVNDVLSACIANGHSARDIVVLAKTWNNLPENGSVNIGNQRMILRRGCQMRGDKLVRDDAVMKKWLNVNSSDSCFVLLTTIHQFKGLEANIVILLDNGNLTDEEHYVGESRGKYKLYIVKA